MDEQRHITFLDQIDSSKQDETDDELTSKSLLELPSDATESFHIQSEYSDLCAKSERSRSRTNSRSTSNSSFRGSRLRKIFVNICKSEELKFFINSSIEIRNDGNLYNSLMAPEADLLNYLMSYDFEECLIQKHGTRKISVHLGSMKEFPEDSDWDLALSANADSGSLSTSFTSVDSFQTNGFNPGTPSPFLDHSQFSFISRDSDTITEKSHVEISKGKGGLFTRSAFHRKSWEIIRDVDICSSDLVFFFWCSDNELIENDTLHRNEYVPIEMLLHPSKPTELVKLSESDLFDTKSESPITPQLAILVESLWARKPIFILCKNSIKYPEIELLKSLHPRVQIFEDEVGLKSHFENEDLANELNENLVSWEVPMVQTRLKTRKNVKNWISQLIKPQV